MKKNTFSWSKVEEEWYQRETICNVCDSHFMTDFDEEEVGVFCPRCGTKLIWDKVDNYEGDGRNE